MPTPRPYAIRSPRRVTGCLVGVAASLLTAASTLTAQEDASARARQEEGAAGAPAYPVAPSPVLDGRRLSPSPALSGYISVRHTRRNDSTSMAINRARITLMGAPRTFLLYRLQADLSAAGRVDRDSTVPASVLTDAYVQLSPPRDEDSTGASTRRLGLIAALRPALVIGQFRTPFSLEYLTPFSLLKTANRSLPVDRLSPRRDIGVMLQLHAGDRVTLAGALLNGEGSNATRNADNAELAAGRLTLRPFGPEFAVAGKWAGQGPDHLWGYDVRWVWRGATLEGEAIHRAGHPPGAANLEPVPNPPYSAGGWYVLAAYKLLPWLEAVAKWERLREQVAASAGDAPGSETWVTAGTIVHTPDDRLRLQLNWIGKRVQPLGRRSNELVAQLIAIY